jgi:hypothetical protein
VIRAADFRLLAVIGLTQLVLGVAVRVARVAPLTVAIARQRARAQGIVGAPDERIAWAIEAVGRRLPGISTCLVRALAADLFLTRADRPGHVRIGVRRTSAGQLQSHAWFERDARILVGAAGADDYVQFTTLDGHSARRH